MIVDKKKKKKKKRLLNQSRRLTNNFLQDISEGNVLREFISISFAGYHPKLPLFLSGELKSIKAKSQARR